MLKVWNVVLIISTYLLAIFGTFLTRSGIVSSVHAFAQSSIGTYFAIFLTAMGAFSVYLIVSRLDFLKSKNQLDSYASREASFLFNNLVLLAACFAVLWGTIFPVISELIQGEQITVGAPFFNKINVPIGLFLLFLTGVGPLLAWRKTSLESMLRIFMWPTIVGAVVMGIAFLAGARSLYPMMSFGLSGFVTATLVAEFSRAASARARNTGENLITSLIRITEINKRRYGGYIVHFGFVLLIIGLTGQAFTTEGWGEAKEGERFTIGSYEFECTNIRDISEPNFAGLAATVQVFKGDKEVTTLAPEKRFYHASEQTTSEVRMHHTLKEDVYVVFAGMNEENDRAIFQVWVNPLVAWVWIGTIVMVLGTIVTILPNRRERKIRRQSREVERLLRSTEAVSS
jgi:cytochrome c-type biogenesis protein CcmF